MEEYICPIEVGVALYYAGDVVKKDDNWFARIRKVSEVWCEDSEEGIRWGNRVEVHDLLLETTRHMEPQIDSDYVWGSSSIEEFLKSLDKDNEIAFVIEGVNDTYEGGYVAAVLNETVDIPLPIEKVEQWQSDDNYQKSLYLEFEGLTDGTGSGPVLIWGDLMLDNLGYSSVPGEKYFQLPYVASIQGWDFASKDQ